MENPQMTLFCEYLHCCGKRTVVMGTAASPAEAAQWAEDKNRQGQRPSLPPEDLIRTCPVRHCPAKIQVPRYGYTRALPD